jgi:hypothetical protein
VASKRADNLRRERVYIAVSHGGNIRDGKTRHALEGRGHTMTGEETIPYIMARVKNTDFEIKELMELQRQLREYIAWKKTDNKEVERLSTKRFRRMEQIKKKMEHKNNG